jgi:hypothetical protein
MSNRRLTDDELCNVNKSSFSLFPVAVFLTVVLACMKVAGVQAISWFIAFLPLIIYFVPVAILLVVAFVIFIIELVLNK